MTKYTQHDDDTQHDLLKNLEALCHQSPLFTANAGSVLGDEDDTWMLLKGNARIDLEVECWGRRLA